MMDGTFLVRRGRERRERPVLPADADDDEGVVRDLERLLGVLGVFLGVRVFTVYIVGKHKILHINGGR